MVWPASPGFELFGPWADGEAVREAIVEAARSSGCARSAAAPTRRTRSSRAGSPRRCPRCTPATADGVSRVAAGRGLRGLGVDRRQLRLRQHRGLLFDAVGPRLRALRQVRPRLHRTGGARADGRGKHRQKVTLALDDDDVTRRRSARCSEGRPREVYRLAVGRLLDAPLRPGDDDGETVGVSTWVGYSANEGKMLTLAVMDAEYAEPGTEVTSCGARRTAARASRPSSRTSRWRSARSSARCRTSRPCEARTGPTAGARRAYEARSR